MAIDYGKVEHNGMVINLTQQAYVNNYGTDGGVRYYALGVDDKGNTYQIAWDTTSAWDEMQEALSEGREPAMDAPDPNDESNACDWDSPVEVKLIEACDE